MIPGIPNAPWHLAPPGAEFWAVNANGLSHWFSTEPTVVQSRWENRHGWAKPSVVVDLELGVDWRETCQSKPNTDIVRERIAKVLESVRFDNTLPHMTYVPLAKDAMDGYVDDILAAMGLNK